MVLLEGLVLAFWLLLICVIGTANGAVGLVIFYEQDVQDRVVELGLTTKEKIKKTSVIAGLALYLPMIFVLPVLVYTLNGAECFLDGFIQLTIIYMIANLFDRLFIDIYWVGHTKAWEIPGTEDLKPYIPKKSHIRKWAGSLIGFPLLAAIAAGVAQLFI